MRLMSIPASYKKYDYKTKEFEGHLLVFSDSFSIGFSTEYYPYTQEELTSWLFSRGFKVLQRAASKERGKRLVGLAKYHYDDPYLRGEYTETTSYDLVFYGNYQHMTSATENSPAGSVEIGTLFSWQAYSMPGDMFCDG